MKTYKLKELLTIQNGKDYKKEKDGNVPVYGTGGIMTYIDNYLYEGESILLPRKGTLDNIMYVNGKFWTVDTIYYTIINTKITYPKYLYCYLSLLDLSCRDSGSTLPSMTFDSYYTLDIKLPDIEAQKNIGDKVFKIISKISINNSICSDFEAMAKQLYDYWFVQFDFPDENGKPYKSSGGKMVWNEVLKREIPEGWKVSKFDDIVAPSPKLKAIKAPDYKPIGKFPIVDQADTLITGYTDDDSYLFDNEEDCVVFGDVTTYFKFINFPFAKGTDGTKIIRSINNRIPALLFYYLIKDCSLPNVGFSRHYMFLREIKVLIPSPSICSLFEKRTKAMMNKRKEIILENQTLTSLRDFLLPMLMNGQVKVR